MEPRPVPDIPSLVEQAALVAPLSQSQLCKNSDGIRFFSRDGRMPKSSPEPLRVCVLTSVRDCGPGSCHGREILTQAGPRYFAGALERLLALEKTDLAGKIEIVRIIVDDIGEADGVEAAGFRILPQHKKGDWLIGAQRISDSDWRHLSELAMSVPSGFRKMSRAPEARAERSCAKRAFEDAIAQEARRCGANLILSDSLLVVLESLHHQPDFQHRVINLHPGITWVGDPDETRGVSPTGRILERARGGGPFGPPVAHGATLHFIADGVDAGAVICDVKRTMVTYQDAAMAGRRDEVRLRNYDSSVGPLIRNGLEYLYEHLNSLTDFS